MKEIKDDKNRWNDMPCPYIGRINIVKTMILPEAFYKCDTIPLKLPVAFSTELEPKNLKIGVETPKNSK